ncbi:unnamed protein product [Diatraea saccharalis]|uniref:Vinculin n=1 Tax=Diatraea saccharalis TaxID=40085 RepID=A0A9N9RG23_9NEOP|nr:unnamed protein product [Diatraea saccharalis]
MPVFHTKIIESILEPVAQQVSRLVILHEEAEDGNAMPDLARPVQAVSLAVNNLVKLMSLNWKKLIEGSRGILQGTSALLLCFDESEVRKIVKECKKVLDYLGVAEVIDTMEDLVQFLRDISPALSRAAREVAARAAELTHPPHADTLTRCLESVKQLAPVLICSMKIYIHILTEVFEKLYSCVYLLEIGGKGIEEAGENRNYLAQKMADEIHEIIRVLQLTSYVEDGGEKDNIAVLKALQAQIHSKMGAAHEFLNVSRGNFVAPLEKEKCEEVKDNRGHHANRPRKMSVSTEQNIIAHINLFPVKESHYVRKDTKKLYLDDTLNISKMYRLYIEWFEKENYSNDIKIATKRQYETIFNTKFNYSFHKPKKDICGQCTLYHQADDERKEQLKESYTKHIRNKERVRELKTKDKEEGNPTDTVVAIYDLEKVLTIPQSEILKMEGQKTPITDVLGNELTYLYREPIALPKPLYDDLMSLCKVEAIPKHYHIFYNNLQLV